MWWEVAIGAGVALLASWLALVVALALVRPKGALLGEALRLLPDLVRLLRRLAADPAVRAHWPGTDDGFAALCRIAGLPSRPF
jgi:hypothetical protein